MTETAKGMLSHRTPVGHSTGYLIASWDDCRKSSYSGPSPKRQVTAADEAADANEDALVDLCNVLNNKVSR